MLKKREIGAYFLLVFLFSLALISGVANVTIIEHNSTLMEVRIVNASEIYSYEINFVENNTGYSTVQSNLLGDPAEITSGSTSRSGILSVYQSRLDSNDLGQNITNNTAFNITHTRAIILRQALFVYSNGSEEENNLCSEELACQSWSECVAGSQSRVCYSSICLYDPVVQTQSCTVGGDSGGGSGGGGGGGSKSLILRLIFKTPIINSTGEITIPFFIENLGKVVFTQLTTTAKIYKNGVLTNDQYTIDKKVINSLDIGKKEELVFNTIVNDESLAFYEVELETITKSPPYNASNKVLFTFLGQKAEGVVEIVAFTEGLIQEHPECLELNDMLIKAQEEYRKGNVEKALELANKAIEACKGYLESPLRPIFNQQQYNNLPLYLGIAIAVAIVLGIMFNIYRYYRAKAK